MSRQDDSGKGGKKRRKLDRGKEKGTVEKSREHRRRGDSMRRTMGQRRRGRGRREILEMEGC
jgi:hypothetical protein